jgi:hypothetical protein
VSVPHLAETIMSSFKAKLEDIIPRGGGYHNSGKLRSVQRYRHRFNAANPTVNQLADTPTILLKSVGDSSAGPRELDSRQRTLEVDIEWVARGGEITDEDLIRVREDIEKALFVNPTDLNNSFGVSAGDTDFTVSLNDPVTDQPTDGFHFIVTVPYTTGLDPTTLGV